MNTTIISGMHFLVEYELIEFSSKKLHKFLLSQLSDNVVESKLSEAGVDVAGFKKWFLDKSNRQPRKRANLARDESRLVDRVRRTLRPVPLDLHIDRWTFDGAGFVNELREEVNRWNCAGLSVAIFKDGQRFAAIEKGFARGYGDTDPQPWTSSKKMHIASVSKYVTSMAVVQLLQERDIGVDSLIAPYLPKYLNPSPAYQTVTFRQLLTNNPAVLPKNGGYSYMDFVQTCEEGLPTPSGGPEEKYYNGNWIALRVVMGSILGILEKDIRAILTPAPSSALWFLLNNLWDYETTRAYIERVQSRIFAPAGVFGMSPELGRSTSLAYSLPVAAPGGYLSGTGGEGSHGWWLSVDDICRVAHCFSNTDQIVSKTLGNGAFGAGFGLDAVLRNPFGSPMVGMKNGFWADGDSRSQCSLVIDGPDGWVVAALSNSKLYKPGRVVRLMHVSDIILPVYENHLVS